MATGPDTAQSGSMEETQRPEQPISTQPDAGEDALAAMTTQPGTTEHEAPTSTTNALEAKQAEEGEAVEHLTVISDDLETSKENIVFILS